MENQLTNLIRHEITLQEIQKIFPKVNDGSRYHVDVNTWQFIDRIIEEWFEQKGITFWDMPEIESYELHKDPIKIVFFCHPKK